MFAAPVWQLPTACCGTRSRSFGMSKSNGPTVFVRKRGGKTYFTREQAEKAIRGARNTQELNEAIPKEVQRAFLEQDFTKGKGKDDTELLKRNFKKMSREAISGAMGQPKAEGE